MFTRLVLSLTGIFAFSLSAQAAAPNIIVILADEGLDWIDAQEKADDEKPWFAFFSYNAPHGPMHATEEDKALFSHIENEQPPFTPLRSPQRRPQAPHPKSKFLAEKGGACVSPPTELRNGGETHTAPFSQGTS
ncbi:MAG: hypothetical protein N2A42_06625 [Luteolibacter sp.]